MALPWAQGRAGQLGVELGWEPWGWFPHGQVASKWNMLNFSVPLLAKISSIVISVNQ